MCFCFQIIQKKLLDFSLLSIKLSTRAENDVSHHFYKIQE